MIDLAPSESQRGLATKAAAAILVDSLQQEYSPRLNQAAAQFYFAHDVQQGEFDNIITQLSEDHELKQQVTNLNVIQFQTIAKQAYSWDPGVSAKPFRQHISISNFKEVVPAASVKRVLLTQVLPERVKANLLYILANKGYDLDNYQLLFYNPIEAEPAIELDAEEKQLITTSSEALIKFDVAISSGVFGDDNSNAINGKVCDILSQAQEAEFPETRKQAWIKLNEFCAKIDAFYKPYSLLVQYERENAALKERNPLQQSVAVGLRKDIADIENVAQILPYNDNYFTTLTAKAQAAVSRYKEQCKILEANKKFESQSNRKKRSRIWYFFAAASGGLGGVGLIGIVFSPELAALLGNISLVAGLSLAVLGIAVAFFAKRESWSNKERSVIAISCLASGFFGGISAIPELAEMATLIAPWLAIAAIVLSIAVTKNIYTHNDELDVSLKEVTATDSNRIQVLSSAKKGLDDRQIDRALAFSGNNEGIESDSMPLLSTLSNSAASTGLTQRIAKSSGDNFLGSDQKVTKENSFHL